MKNLTSPAVSAIIPAMKNAVSANPVPADFRPDPRHAAEMADIRAAIAALNAALDRREKIAVEDRVRAEASLAETNRKLDAEVQDRQGLRNSLSRGMEDSFAVSLKPLMAGYGVPLDSVIVRVRNDNRGPEFDIIGLNGTTAVVGEVKIQMKRKDVSAFSDDLRDFRDHFPEHARPTVYGVVAGMTIDDDAAALARKRGFFVLRLDGAVVCPETGGDFRPRAY